MLLEGRNAVIYGAGGAVGSAVARAFARDGARLFLAGRTLGRVEVVAAEIATRRGTAEAAQVDANDEAAIQRHLDEVARTAGSIDILFNAIAMQDIQGTALLDMRTDDVLRPIATAIRTQFQTARAAARHMVQRGAGVILTLTAGPPEPIPYVGGFGAACQAVEGLWRGLAAELGPHGVRVICLRSAGSPDTPDVRQTLELHARASGMTFEECLVRFSNATVLKRMPLVAEVASVAAMMASDRASAMTGTFVHVTCGSRE
jgi:NAD(P)-dependent dehydrogenase (short-subunit alcohol dehydrogenase family)